MKRLPLRLAMMSWGPEACRLQIATPEATGYRLETNYPLGLPPDIAAFIHFHCCCAYCRAPISVDLRRCACGRPVNKWIQLEVEYPTTIDQAVFKPILAREGARIKSMKRKQRIAENGGAYTDDDIAALFEIQEGICYFCGTPISMTSTGNHLHIDHYQPIYTGGKNDVSNLVLTCAACNLRKGAMDGDSFELIARTLRIPEIGRRLGQIRRRLNAFRANQFRGGDDPCQ